MKKITEAVSEHLNERVTLFTKNGYQLKGKLMEVFEDGGVSVFDGMVNIVYPHAISTICVPVKQD